MMRVENVISLRRLSKDTAHRRFEHSAERIAFAGNATLFQTKGRRNLLLRDSGLRLASFNFSVG